MYVFVSYDVVLIYKFQDKFYEASFYVDLILRIASCGPFRHDDVIVPYSFVYRSTE